MQDYVFEIGAETLEEYGEWRFNEDELGKF